MKAMVHIGAPKTGSTSIQTFLADNRAALAGRGVHVGLDYEPAKDCMTYLPIAALFSVGKLPNSQKARKRHDLNSSEEAAVIAVKVNAALEALPSPATPGTVILSCEYILPWMKDQSEITALDQMLRNRFSSVEYVHYMRSPADLLPSIYSQRIKTGASVAFDEFFAKWTDKFDFHAGAMRWRQAVGARYHPRLLERDFLVNGDLIDDFATQCGIEMDGLLRPARANEGLSAEGIEILRRLNARASQGGQDTARTGWHRAVTKQLMAHPLCKTKLRLTTEQRKQVEEKTAANLEALRKDFFPDRPVLFTTAPTAPVQPDRAEIMAAVADIMLDLFVPHGDQKKTLPAPPQNEAVGDAGRDACRRDRCQGNQKATQGCAGLKEM